MMHCTACGAEVPAGSRFCPSCGHPLAAPQAEERRIVTVLFADLVGFTTLAEHLDPEQVKRLVDTCFERLVEVVVEFGGRVDKLLGDGMLVLFGAPIAHEDDPERAIRAALRMQEVVTQYVATSMLIGSDDIRMRVGINTGEVLVGTLAGTDYTAMGDVVNTASRLQSEAPPGGVLVGEATHALTAHTFQFQPMGTLQPRGREQSIEAWLAIAAIAPPGMAKRRRLDVPMVGRTVELALVDAALAMVQHTGRGAVLHVTGENGVGKSRFVDELLTHVRSIPEVVVLEAACVPYGETNVWWPIANALSGYLDIEQSTPVDAAKAIVRESLGPLFADAPPGSSEQLLEVFAHLMGYPSSIDRLDADNARSTIHSTVTATIEAWVQHGPLAFSIDDLHWADPMLIDLLAHLVNSLGRQRFILVTAMRPGSDVTWPPHSDRAAIVSVTLQPLTRNEHDDLARALLNDDAADERLLTALFDRSGGNPLFLHELVALRDAGGGKDELPDSLRTLIAARIDQLTAPQRATLENAAVLGTSGSVPALERFAVEVQQEFDPAVLQELDELGLIEVTGRRWAFRSESVRDAAYQTLTKAARARRHAGVAKALANVTGQLDDRAHHAACAAEIVQELGAVTGVPADINIRAVELLTTAADRAIEGGSIRMAVRHASRALDLAQVHPSAATQLAHLRYVRANCYLHTRNFADATADIDALESIADALDDPIMKAQAHRIRGAVSQAAGRIDEARSELGRAVDLLRSAQRPELLADALRMRGFIEMFGGSLPDAEWFFGEANELYQTLGNERGLAYIEQHRARVAFLTSHFGVARERLTSAAQTLERLGDRNGVGWALGLLAFVEFYEGNFDAAEELVATVSRDAADRGDDWGVNMMHTLLANLRLWQGRLDEAVVLAERARAQMRKLDDKFGLSQALAPLLRTQVALGRVTMAQRTAEELLTLTNTSQVGPSPALAVAGAAMHRGDGQNAVLLAERAMRALEAVGGRTYEPMVILALGKAQLGQLDEALSAIHVLIAGGSTHPATHAAAALIHAAAHQPEHAIAHARRVESATRAMYLDPIFAFTAEAAAHHQLGHPDEATSAAQHAVDRAIAVGDVVAVALATTIYGIVTGTPHREHDERSPLPDGWQRLIDLAVSAGE